MYTIKDITEGKCAVINDGTFEELETVLKKAFPDAKYKLLGKMTYYRLSKTKDEWLGINHIHDFLPTQSVKDFLKPLFKAGENVWVRNHENGKWENRIYIGTFDKLYNKYVCVATGSEQNFKNILYTGIVGWKYIQKIEEEKIVELTLQEISEKLGIPVNLLRIKD